MLSAVKRKKDLLLAATPFQRRTSCRNGNTKLRRTLQKSKLNELGQDGWELVAVSMKTSLMGYRFYLKRPVE
jgi:hypothetical protein